MAYVSLLAVVLARHQQAVDAGLQAAAAQVKQAVVKGYNPPEYFIGAAARARRYPKSIHPTGLLLNSITVSPPFDAGTGARSIAVGTNVRYALYWELGWMPAIGQRVYDPETDRAFLVQNKHGPRRMLRKPVWVPALVSSAPAAQAAFARVYARFMGGGWQAPSIAYSGPAQDIAAD